MKEWARQLKTIDKQARPKEPVTHKSPQEVALCATCTQRCSATCTNTPMQVWGSLGIPTHFHAKPCTQTHALTCTPHEVHTMTFHKPPYKVLNLDGAQPSEPACKPASPTIPIANMCQCPSVSEAFHPLLPTPARITMGQPRPLGSPLHMTRCEVPNLASMQPLTHQAPYGLCHAC